MGWGKEWPESKHNEKHTIIYEGPNTFPEIKLLYRIHVRLK